MSCSWVKLILGCGLGRGLASVRGWVLVRNKRRKDERKERCGEEKKRRRFIVKMALENAKWVCG